MRRYKSRRRKDFGLSNNYWALPAVDISKGVCIALLHQSSEMFLCDGSNVMLLGCLLLFCLWPGTSETAGSGSRTGRHESFLTDAMFAISTSGRPWSLKALCASVARSVRLQLGSGELHGVVSVSLLLVLIELSSGKQKSVLGDSLGCCRPYELLEACKMKWSCCPSAGLLPLAVTVLHIFSWSSGIWRLQGR